MINTFRLSGKSTHGFCRIDEEVTFARLLRVQYPIEGGSHEIARFLYGGLTVRCSRLCQSQTAGQHAGHQRGPRQAELRGAVFLPFVRSILAVGPGRHDLGSQLGKGREEPVIPSGVRSGRSYYRSELL